MERFARCLMDWLSRFQALRRRWRRFAATCPWGFFAKFTRETRKLCLVAEGPSQGLAELRGLLQTGKLVPVIDRTFQLSEVPDALRYFGEGRHKGKIVIAVTRS